MPINPDDLLLVSRGGSDYKYPADSFIGEKGDKGDDGAGVEPGGTTGQVLAKASNTSFDIEWTDLQVTLAEVLEAGNIADHGIELTDGTDDLIIVSPEEALIGIASDLEAKKPRFRLAHIDEHGYPDSHAQWEIDDDGTRNDIDLGGKIEALHVRFDDQETFTLDKTGDAEFTGKLKAAPAVESTELSTLGQLEAVESDIQDEQTVQNQQINALETQIQLLAQTQAAGKWTYQRNITTSVRPPATATFYGTHSADVTTVLTNWSDLRLIMVDKTDISGTTYTFSNFEQGDKIEILATDGSSACFGTVSNDPNNDSYGNLIVTVERSNGGPAEGKEYVLSVYRPGANGGDVDLDVLDGRYVIKTGDTITGNLQLNNQLNVDGKSAFKDSVRVFPTEDSSKESFIVFGRVEGYHDSAMLIATNNNWYQKKDDCIEYYGTSVTDESLVNAKWVSDAINAAVDGGALSDDYLATTGGVLTGNLVLQSGGLYSDSIIKSTRVSGYAFQVKPDDGNPTAFIHTNGNAEFANVKVEAEPTNSSDLTNKLYVDTKVGDYLPLTGGSMTGGIDIDRESGAGLELKKEGTSNLKLWVDGGITTTKTTFNDDQLVTKAYVDDAIGDIDIPSPDLSSYLQKSGGTMTGDAYIRFSSGGLNFKKADGSTKSYFYNASDTTTQWTSYNGTKIVITARDGEPGGGRTFIDIQNVDNNGTGGDDSGYRMKLYHVADPTADLHAANKRYVDAAMNYPGLRFKFSSGTGAVIGKFNYYDSGGLRLRVSNTSQDYKWNDGGLSVDYSFSEGHRFSIYEKLSDGTLKIIRTGTYNRADYHSGDVLFRVSSHQTNGSFNTSSDYYLVISGLF